MIELAVSDYVSRVGWIWMYRGVVVYPVGVGIGIGIAGGGKAVLSADKE